MLPLAVLMVVATPTWLFSAPNNFTTSARRIRKLDRLWLAQGETHSLTILNSKPLRTPMREFTPSQLS
jgi:hypothetical protein